MHTGQDVYLQDAPMIKGYKPKYRQYGVKGGGMFMYKAEPECWHNGGYESKKQNLPIKFDGYGVSVNLWAWQTKMKENEMDLIYMATVDTGGKFYITYYPDLKYYEWNIGLSTLGERCLDVPIKAFKLLNIAELKRHYGL